MLMRKIAVCAALCLVPLGALAEDYPLTAQDAREGEVILKAQPERVIALSAFAADLMVELGKHPVGVTTYEGKRPVYLGGGADDAVDLGDITAPNFELMATLDPDLTVGMLLYNGPFEKEISEISPFLAYNEGGVELSYWNVVELGRALGHADDAQALNTEFDALRKSFAAKTNQDGPSYLFLWHYHDAFYAFQDNLMSTELLSALGAKNLVGYNQNVESAEQAFTLMDPEDLLKIDPDVLLVFSSHGGGVKAHPAFQRLKAVTSGRAWSVGYQYSQPAGPIARDLVLREGAHLLFPEVFDAPDMDPRARAVALKLID